MGFGRKQVQAQRVITHTHTPYGASLLNTHAKWDGKHGITQAQQPAALVVSEAVTKSSGFLVLGSARLNGLRPVCCHLNSLVFLGISFYTSKNMGHDEQGPRADPGSQEIMPQCSVRSEVQRARWHRELQRSLPMFSLLACSSRLTLESISHKKCIVQKQGWSTAGPKNTNHPPIPASRIHSRCRGDDPTCMRAGLLFSHASKLHSNQHMRIFQQRQAGNWTSREYAPYPPFPRSLQMRTLLNKCWPTKTKDST